jgi:S-adenosylmethionine:tRNA ribosyltransferase-isomerase
LIKPARVKLHEKIQFNATDIFCEVTAKNEVAFTAAGIDAIYGLGVMPLPPYIKRDPQDSDEVDYQTVYAREHGSIASPTAGLHFTQELISSIGSRGVSIAYVTLHVGYATFKPVKAENITEHIMEKEEFQINQHAASAINRTRAKGGRIFAVGTTSCRVLETYASGIMEGATGLFIYPGYSFKMVDCLLTNFHLPRTTLLMLVSAFAGKELIKIAYREAVDKKYRFYSYGDAMLVI